MKVGIIGASFARQAYLPAFRNTEGCEVVALASARLDSARAAAAAFDVPHAYDDWRRMIETHNLDLVCIATPTVTHAPMALAAIEAGAHVLCEKPTAMNADEARRMLDCAEAHGRIHMIDHELRFNPSRRRVKALIDQGHIGEIRHVDIINIGNGWGDPASRPLNDWWSSSEQGGGRLGANGSHQVDLLRWWLGEPKATSGQALTMVPNRVDPKSGEPFFATADDVTHFTLEMPKGVLASVFISGVARHALENATRIVGSEGTITISQADERLMVARAGQPFEDMSIEDPNESLPGVNKGVWSVSVVGLVRELVAAIAEKRQPRHGATFHDGWRNQLVLDAVLRSSRERRWIDVPAP